MCAEGRAPMATALLFCPRQDPGENSPGGGSAGALDASLPETLVPPLTL